MSGGSRIIPIEGGSPVQAGAQAIGAAEEDNEAVLELSVEADDWATGEEEEEAPAPRGGWAAPALAALAVFCWTGFFAFANWSAIAAGAAPAQWAAWIVAWSVPVLLVLTVLLVAMRTSRREALRFGDVTRSLAQQSHLLEGRLRTVNTELSLARDFIASQARDLEALGRIAVDRLSGTAGELETLISDNGEKLERIATVSDNAAENMEKLRGQLPVIANAAKDVTNNIGNAGRTAHVQLEEMIAGFQKLNEFGLASERQVETLREQVGNAHEEFQRSADQIGEIAEARFAALGKESAAHRERLDQDEIAALAAIRGRAAALSEELAAHRESIETAEREAIAALRERLATLERESGDVTRGLAESESNALTSWQQRAAAHAVSLREALASLTEDHDRAIEAAATRLATFDQSARDIAGGLEAHGREVEASLGARFVAMESKLAEQRETLTHRLGEIDAAIAERRQAMADAGAAAADTLARKLADFDAVIDEHRQHQAGNAQALAEQCEAVGERVAAFSNVLRASGEQGERTAQQVDAALGRLNGRLTDSREMLEGTDEQIAGVTHAAVRLLEIIQAGSDHARKHIPSAIGDAEQGLRGIEDRVSSVRDTLAEASNRSQSLSEFVIETRHKITEAISELGQLHQSLSGQAAAQGTALAAMRESLAEAHLESETLSHDIDTAIARAVEGLAGAARKVGEELRGSTAGEIEAIATQLSEESSAAISKVLQHRGAELVARLEEALDHAAEANRENAIDMRDQLAKIDELAGNLENRVTRARERAEEQLDNDFARRAALITESLNSTAIDIAKALSADVSDTAWASYLRGDRGIFTRRAVSLLDSAEAKSVQQHYETDADFREHVNRYIHDFESILRQLLSTRDGNALSVTLLSSDMGKLYVALAQGIERLRT